MMRVTTSCLGYSLILKMERVCSPETSVDFHWTTCCYILEDGTLQNLYFIHEHSLTHPAHFDSEDDDSTCL
jgi:hypothetical protein